MVRGQQCEEGVGVEATVRVIVRVLIGQW
jgi:hypothetical protein